MRKFISLFMLLAVLFLVSCENVEYHTESSEQTSEESLNIYEELESQLPGMSGEDIEEREFVIFTDRVTTYSYDETAPESINLAILERASFLESNYGATIVVKDLTVNEIAQKIRVSDLSDSNICHMISLSAQDTVKLFTLGLLGDINALPDFNLENGFFNTDLAKTLATNNSLYMLADPCTYIYDDANVIFYNRNLVKPNEAGEDVESLVLQGKWTWDKFNEFCRLAAPNSYSGSGSDVNKDTFAYGYDNNDDEFVSAMWTACDLQMIGDTYKQEVQLAMDRSTAGPFAEYLHSVFNVRGRYPVAGKSALAAFEEGRIAFYFNELGYFHTLRDGNGEGDEYGILPIPKISEEQEGYNSLLSNTAHVISIPKTLLAADEETKSYASLIISATCATGSVTMRQAYLDAMLGIYLINNNETLIMQTIVDSICFDFASVYGSGVTEIYTPAVESITKCIIDGTSFSISDKRKFEDYCTTNFQ